MIIISTGHYEERLEVLSKKDNDIIFLEEKRDELYYFGAIEKAHEANTYRSAN